MSSTGSNTFWSRLARLGVAGQAALVSLVIAGLALITAPIAQAVSGTIGLAAVGVAGGACWVGALAALLFVSLFPTPQTALYGLAGGMFFRTTLPMVVGVVLHFKVPALADAGMIFYLLVFYMATLATETLLLVAKIPNTPNRRNPASDPSHG
ncbi:MAG: hypothetical protein DWQ37_02610 [Planctomycetota bacterium]|nr:MAG: hypothetical protein DWQ37_02610 [Planctomycetota bacterium]